MARKIVSACALALSLWVVTPALAQTPVWSAERPDGHAPSGVMADYSLEGGEFYFGYRYYRTDFAGTLVRNLSTTMGHSTGLIREQCPVW